MSDSSRKHPAKPSLIKQPARATKPSLGIIPTTAEVLAAKLKVKQSERRGGIDSHFSASRPTLSISSLSHYTQPSCTNPQPLIKSVETPNNDSSNDESIESDTLDDHVTPDDDSSTECSDTEEECAQTVYTLPFPNMEHTWYSNEQRYYNMNRSRNTLRSEAPVQRNESDDLVYVNRSQVGGTIEENVLTLHELARTSKTKTSTCAQYSAILKVGEYILQNGPLVKTQDAGNIFSSVKGVKRRMSSEYYQLFAKYLNLIQLYIFGVGFLFPNSSTFDPEKFIKQIKATINTEDILRGTISERLSDLLPMCLKYADTHRDRLIIKGIFAELTSIKFTAKLQGLTSRQGTRNAKEALHSGLNEFQNIQQTSLTVRSDLTVVQQHQLVQRIISKRKIQEIKTIASGRGRKLKAEEYPIAIALEYAFGELDLQRGGGGLQSHPRLITGTLYRSTGNATSMKEAREILLCLAPESFKISLRSCYNYTENYREGTRQAKCHHAGRGVNAQISLKRPPRTGVQQFVVNLHWSTSNVNNIIDTRTETVAAISKDAKVSITADCSPVQNPGKSWKKLEFPDHTFDQSRTNQVTPMTFLCLETKYSSDPVTIKGESINIITRSGQGVTFLYLSFFEPDTAVKCLNEVLYLITLPKIRHFFINTETGKPKKEIVFVVDNGPQEKPSNPIVQMCLVRLLNFLKLYKVTQVSFAEYYSKRNFVERVHAQENQVLSAHGPFQGQSLYKNPRVGSSEHRANMEAMAGEIQKCIESASFGGKQLICRRGLTE